METRALTVLEQTDTTTTQPVTHPAALTHTREGDEEDVVQLNWNHPSTLAAIYSGFGHHSVQYTSRW